MTDDDTPQPSSRTATPAESICPFCGVGCGIQYNGAGKATGWRGPVNTRGEICPKGAAAWDVVDHPDRLTTPLVRENGALREATWDEALGRVVVAFEAARADHGPDALAFFASSNCTNEENYVFQKLARALGTNNVDNCARLCHSSTVAAMQSRLGAGAMTNSLDDLREADVFLVVGAIPPTSTRSSSGRTSCPHSRREPLSSTSTRGRPRPREWPTSTSPSDRGSTFHF